MSDKKIVVPEGMLKAVEIVALSRTMPRGGSILPNILEAALLWQKENAPVPTETDLNRIEENHRNNVDLWNRFGSSSNIAYICWAWIMSMYDDPEKEVSEVPEEIKDLLCYPDNPKCFSSIKHDVDIIEAFRRGQKAGTK